MTRNGKIARLPRLLREEVNRRLENGTPGRAIVAWLNERPDVREVMAQYFGGSPVSEQNLTDWKQGGYAAWLARQELVEQVREAAGDAAELAAAGGALADQAASLLAARFLLVLGEWDGTPGHPALAKLRALSEHGRELIALRRGDHSAARLRMEQARFEREQAAAEEQDRRALKRQFDAALQNWLEQPDTQRRIENGSLTTADHIRAVQHRVYGPLAIMIESEDERRLTRARMAIDGDGI